MSMAVSKPVLARLPRVIESACVAVILLGLTPYAVSKIAHTQFGRTYERHSLLETTIREINDYQMVWLFHGRSPAYETFLGVIEIVGVALVFLRFTRPVGAILTMAVMLNITTIDILYGVAPGALWMAMTLMIAATVLAGTQRDVYRQWLRACRERVVPSTWTSLVVKTVLVLAVVSLAIFQILSFRHFTVPHTLSGTWTVTRVDGRLPTVAGNVALGVGDYLSFDSYGVAALRRGDAVNYGSYELDQGRQTLHISMFDVGLREYQSSWDDLVSFKARLFTPDRLRYALTGNYTKPDGQRMMLSFNGEYQSTVLLLGPR
jgi:hypothetical protein